MLRVGLTGGIASGKSVVAGQMVACGASLIDADVLAADAVSRGTSAWREVVKTFGPCVLKENGDIDREWLGNQIFRDRTLRNQLNAIVHPWVFLEYERQVRAAVKADPRVIILFDVPLLFETGAQSLVDRIIVAYVDKNTQVHRMIKRDGLRRSEALLRVEAQLPLSQKKKKADFLVDTRKPLASVRKDVRHIYAELRRIERETWETNDKPLL